jgi:hypothetical protein
MNPRHAATLALVGWYLMMPPAPDRPGGPVDTSIPLSKWKITDSYDAAYDCNVQRLIVQGYMANPNTGKKIKSTPRGDATVCVATDDPRLAK